MTTIADQIRTEVQSRLAILPVGGFKVSDELPFTASGEPLYVKNKKTVYVDDDVEGRVQLYRTLDQGSVYATETTVTAYLTVDAKNQPGIIDTVITLILDAKDVITGAQIVESTVTSEIEEDYVTYSFEYNITKL
jgi:hypothetical protein